MAGMGWLTVLMKGGSPDLGFWPGLKAKGAAYLLKS